MRFAGIHQFNAEPIFFLSGGDLIEDYVRISTANIRITETEFRKMPISRRRHYLQWAIELHKKGMVPITTNDLFKLLCGG